MFCFVSFHFYNEWRDGFRTSSQKIHLRDAVDGEHAQADLVAESTGHAEVARLHGK
jgi:hypothetical protein